MANIKDPQEVKEESEKWAREHWARDWMFADVDFDHHHFVEKMSSRLPKETFCAFTASFLVSPMVSIIDKAIVQAGNGDIVKAMSSATKEMVLAPVGFLSSLSFRMTFLVYFGTYLTANYAEALLDYRKVRGETERKTYKVSAAAVANVSLLMWRDAVFARAFAKEGAKPKGPTPIRTFALFGVRDFFTMFATFYVAPQVAAQLTKDYGVERNSSELGCALAIPMVTQVLTAPFHIHAMNYYQVPVATTAERIQAIKDEFRNVSFARSFRILPAFGIGSFSNNKFREFFIRQENEDFLLTHRLTKFVTRMQTQRN